MPGVLKSQREASIRFRKVWRYAAYAAGEIVLIFVGITLAISFDVANERRQTQELEAQILGSIAENLVANIEELNENIVWDSEAVRLLDPILESMAAAEPLTSQMEQSLSRIRLWSTPYLATSGYENLKQLGLHLVSVPEIRDELVHLFENTYARLLGDFDAGQRLFEAAVLLPVVNRELAYIDPLANADPSSETGWPAMRVRDYEGALSRGELLQMLSDHRRLLVAGLKARKGALSETQALLVALRANLSAEH